MKYVNTHSHINGMPTCYICALKAKGFYKLAIKEVKDGLYGYCTGLLKLKTGWSFVIGVWWAGACIAVMKNTHLNKTPKTSVNKKDLFSAWQLKIAKNYNYT